MVVKKLNLTEQKQKCDNKPKHITTQNKHKQQLRNCWDGRSWHSKSRKFYADVGFQLLIWET